MLATIFIAALDRSNRLDRGHGPLSHEAPQQAVYTVVMRWSGIIPALLAALAAITASATEVYRWVDENGVVHFSQSAPHGKVSGVDLLVLDDTPPDHDPDEDLYGVEAQAERMALLREEMAKKQELARERQRNAAQQPVAPYQQPYDYPASGYWGYPRPPYRPRPPQRPDRPVVAPYPTDELKPPGRAPDQ